MGSSISRANRGGGARAQGGPGGRRGGRRGQGGQGPGIQQQGQREEQEPLDDVQWEEEAAPAGLYVSWTVLRTGERFSTPVPDSATAQNLSQHVASMDDREAVVVEPTPSGTVVQKPQMNGEFGADASIVPRLEEWYKQPYPVGSTFRNIYVHTVDTPTGYAEFAIEPFEKGYRITATQRDTKGYDLSRTWLDKAGNPSKAAPLFAQPAAAAKAARLHANATFGYSAEDPDISMMPSGFDTGTNPAGPQPRSPRPREFYEAWENSGFGYRERPYTEQDPDIDMMPSGFNIADRLPVFDMGVEYPDPDPDPYVNSWDESRDYDSFSDDFGYYPGQKIPGQCRPMIPPTGGNVYPIDPFIEADEFGGDADDVPGFVKWKRVGEPTREQTGTASAGHYALDIDGGWQDGGASYRIRKATSGDYVVDALVPRDGETNFQPGTHMYWIGHGGRLTDDVRDLRTARDFLFDHPGEAAKHVRIAHQTAFGYDPDLDPDIAIEPADVCPTCSDPEMDSLNRRLQAHNTQRFLASLGPNLPMMEQALRPGGAWSQMTTPQLQTTPGGQDAVFLRDLLYSEGGWAGPLVSNGQHFGYARVVFGQKKEEAKLADVREKIATLRSMAGGIIWKQ